MANGPHARPIFQSMEFRSRSTAVFPTLSAIPGPGNAAPVDASQAFVGALNAASSTALKIPEVRRALQAQGEARTGMPRDFGVFLAEDRKPWADFVRVSGVNLE
jgi:hypothetical protein